MTTGKNHKTRTPKAIALLIGHLQSDRTQLTHVPHRSGKQMMTQIEVISQIKSEIQIDTEGKAFVSIRGAARLADVDEKSLRYSFQGAEQKPSQLAVFLMQQGFDPAEQTRWSSIGVPDLALSLVLEYYAYECQERYRTQQAKLCCRAFRAIGIRTWIQKELNWQQDLPPKLPSITDLTLTIDLIFSGTSIDKNLVAGVKGNTIAKLHPQLAPAVEEAKNLLAASTAAEEQLVTPTRLGEIIGDRTGKRLSAKTVNVMLANAGLQSRNHQKDPAWIPTEKGKRWGQVTLNTAKGKDKTVQNTRWYPSVVNQLISEEG